MRIHSLLLSRLPSQALESAQEGLRAHDASEHGQGARGSNRVVVRRIRILCCGCGCGFRAPHPVDSSEIAAFLPAIRSAMMHHLARDTGASFALLVWIRLNDMTALNSTCQTWRTWLAPPKAFLPRIRETRPSQFARLNNCLWVRIKLIRVTLLPESDAVSRSIGQLLSTFQSCLLGLGHFSPLRGLILHVQVATVCESVLRSCFDALGSLVGLQLHLPVDGAVPGCDALVRLVFTHASRLPDLLKLAVYGRVHAPETLPLDALPLIVGRFAGLCHLSLESQHNKFRATPEQARCLAACAHLRHLEFGLWDADPALFDAARPIDEKTQLVRRIGVLVRHSQSPIRTVRRRLHDSQPSRYSHERCFLGSALSTSRIVSTVDFVRCSTVVRLSSEEWFQLRIFSKLVNLRIFPAEIAANGRSLIRVADFLSTLIHCTMVQHLSFGVGLSFTAAQLQLICVSLPLLFAFGFRGSFLESLLPLVSAPKLRTLTIVGCKKLNGDPLLVRVCLPPMAQLDKLDLVDCEDQRLTLGQAAALNDAVLLRCPRFRLEKFSQNLLPRAAVDADLV